MYNKNLGKRVLYCYISGKTGSKMVDFHNHRRFTFRCTKTRITPVSCKLRTQSRPPRADKSSKRQLLYERVRSINYTLSLCVFKRDTCHNRLKDLLDTEIFQVSWTFINRFRDSLCNKVKYRKIAKFNRLLNQQGYMYDNDSFGSNFNG